MVISILRGNWPDTCASVTDVEAHNQFYREIESRACLRVRVAFFCMLNFTEKLICAPTSVKSVIAEYVNFYVKLK